MSNNNSKITKPINIESDLGYVLGTGSGDVGTNCKVVSVNPWALYKPVAKAGFGPVTRDSSEGLGLGDSARSGYPPFATSISQFIAFYNENVTLGGKPANGWRWIYPRGVSYNEPYRVYDFLKYVAGAGVASNTGYNHNARNPFGRFVCSPSVTNYYGIIHATNRPTMLADQDVPETDITIGSGYSGNTNPGDINRYMDESIQMAYYGILLVPPSGSGSAYKLICNTDYKIFDAMTYRGHENLTLEEFELSPTLFATEGTYTAYPFLTNYDFPSTKHMEVNVNYANSEFNSLGWSGMRLYPLAGSIPQSVIIYADSLKITVVATNGFDYNGGFSTKIYFKVKNEGDSSVTIPEFMLKIRGGRTYDAARVSGEVFYDKNFMYDDSDPRGHSYNNPELASMLGTSITVAAGEEVRVPSGGSVLVSSPTYNTTTFYIGCTVNTRTHSGSTIVRVPAQNE